MESLPNLDILTGPEEPGNILSLPIDKLVQHQDELIRESQIFRKAFKSKLYHDHWNIKKDGLDHLQGRDGLQHLSLVDGKDLLSCFETSESINKTLFTRPLFWLVTRGTTGAKKWIPITHQDILHWFKRVHRLHYLYREEGRDTDTLVLAINEPKPRASNAIPYLWEQVDYHLGGANIEWIIVSMEMLPRNHWDQFVIQKQPDWIMSSVKDAFDLAEKIDLQGLPDIKTALPKLERGFFWGANLDGSEDQRSKLRSTFGLSEIYSLYFSAECREMYAECKSHHGLHLWMDGAVHEILLSSGETLFVDQAKPGMEGEYIVTTFYESLPLIRYKTGDIIRVVDTDPCECGITHPRVEFIARVEEG